MPLDDDLLLPLSDEELTRRKLLELIGGAAVGVAALGTLTATVKYLDPPVFFEEDSRLVIGRPEDIAPGTVLVLPKQRVYVVRTAAGFYALSSVCTHLGCMTRYDKEGAQIACPCHGSRFTLDGHVKHGPAPKPLPRLQCSIERGLLVVDTAKRVAPDALLEVA
jgi:cytochrome b6-f complex iron-sulfur subunit